jgi:hypothetical protein
VWRQQSTIGPDVKSPAALQQYRSGRNDLGESKLGGRNIKEYLHPRNTDLREVVIRGDKTREADPFFAWGRPMISWKKQVRAHGVPPGYGIQHPGKILRDNVGKLPGAAGTAYNLPGLFERG